MQRALVMTLPASAKSACERCFSSAMEANALTGFKPTAGSGVAAETARPVPMIARAPARLIAVDRMHIPFTFSVIIGRLVFMQSWIWDEEKVFLGR